MTAYNSTMLQALAVGGGFAPGHDAQAAAGWALAVSGGDPNWHSGNLVGLWGVPAGTNGYTAQQLASPTTNALGAHAMYVANGNKFPTVTVQNDPGLVPDLSSVQVPGLSGVEAIAGDFDKTARWLTTPANWIHIAYVIGGAAMVLAGLVVVARPAISGAANGVTKVATGATPVGRATRALGRVRSRNAAAGRQLEQRVQRGAERTRRETERRGQRVRVQQRIEERHQMARNREARAAERHAARRTAPKAPAKKAPAKKESSSGD